MLLSADTPELPAPAACAASPPPSLHASCATLESKQKTLVRPDVIQGRARLLLLSPCVRLVWSHGATVKVNAHEDARPAAHDSLFRARQKKSGAPDVSAHIAGVNQKLAGGDRR
jgi:hypothetical protein